MVTPPGLADAAPVSTVKLGRRARRRRLRAGLRRTTRRSSLVPSVPAVGPPIAQLVAGQADVGRPAGEGVGGAAVRAGGLVTPVAAVVHPIAAEA